MTYPDPDAFYNARIQPAFDSVGGTLLFKGSQAPDGRPEGVTLEQAVWWTDYRTKIIEGKIDALIGLVQALAQQAGGAAADAAGKLDQILADLAKGAPQS